MRRSPQPASCTQSSAAVQETHTSPVLLPLELHATVLAEALLLQKSSPSLAMIMKGSQSSRCDLHGMLRFYWIESCTCLVSFEGHDKVGKTLEVGQTGGNGGKVPSFLALKGKGTAEDNTVSLQA